MAHTLETTPTRTFADVMSGAAALGPRLYNPLLVLAGAMAVGVSAQLAIPTGSGVPITGQTFAVLLVGAALGWRLGISSMLTYLALGFMGLPVFAHGAAGPAVFVGPSAGFLIGFVFCAGIVGYLAQQGWDRNVWKTAAMMTLGTGTIFACGVVWVTPWAFTVAPELFTESGTAIGTILALYVIPFLPGAVVKIALAMALLPGAWKIIGRRW